MRKILTSIALVLSLVAGCVDPASTTSAASAISAAQVTVPLPVYSPGFATRLDTSGRPLPEFPVSSWDGATVRNVVRIPITVPVGSTLNQASIRVHDTGTDGCFFALYDQMDGAYQGPDGQATAFSFATHSLNNWSNITLQNDLNLLVTAGHQYSLVVYFGHFGPCFVNAANVTYTPSP